jgi:hypothetical protein
MKKILLLTSLAVYSLPSVSDSFVGNKYFLEKNTEVSISPAYIEAKAGGTSYHGVGGKFSINHRLKNNINVGSIIYSASVDELEYTYVNVTVSRPYSFGTFTISPVIGAYSNALKLDADRTRDSGIYLGGQVALDLSKNLQAKIKLSGHDNLKVSSTMLELGYGLQEDLSFTLGLGKIEDTTMFSMGMSFKY